MAYTELALYCDSVAYTAVAQWAASTAYTVGQIRRQLAAPAVANERCFVCVVAGTSGGAEPNWAINASFKGNKITDNTVTWQECTAQPSLNGDSVNVPAWKTAAGTIAIGTIIKNTAGTHYFITTTSGSGTTTEPTWNTTTGATTNDGSNTWTCIGAISSFSTRWAAPAARFQHLLNGNTSWLLNAGMTIYVGDDHSESVSTNLGAGFSCQVLCVDHTVALPPGSGDLKTTAAITVSLNKFWGNAFNGYLYGLQFISSASNAAPFNGLGAARLVVERCLFSSTSALTNLRYHIGDNSNVGSIVECKNCTLSVAGGTTSFAIDGNVRMENCSFSTGPVGSTAQIFSGGNAFVNFVAEGCDFASNIGSGVNLVGSGADGAPYGYLLFKDCVLPSSMTAIYRGGDAAITNAIIELTRCDNGTGIYRNERHSAEGTELTSTSVVRTGGASDGGTFISHQISTNVNTNNYARVFNAVPFVAWNDTTGASRTVTVYGIANDSRVPNNDECWCDVEYLGSSSSPDGSYVRGLALPLAAGAALTADTSAWDSVATARANSTAYVVGDVRKVASNSGRVFFCTVAGTSAASEPGGYASAVDGGAVVDGTATFRAGCRFKQTLTLFSPQPAQIGYIYTFPKLGRASTTYVLDPTLELATSPLDLATLTWIAAVVSAGGSVSSGRQTAVNNLVAGLKADGVWTKLDRLWLFAAENTQSARLDLVTRATASFGGSPFPAFTIDRGYTGGGNGYIETFFNAVSSGGVYAQNSAHIGIWGNTAIPDSNPSMGTNLGVCDYIYTRQASSGSAFWGVQDSGFTLSTTMANGLGHYIANRSASNAQQGYKNGSLINSNTTASTSQPNFNIVVLGAGSQRTGIQASAAHIGGSLSATDAGNFYTRLRAYMTAVGVP